MLVYIIDLLLGQNMLLLLRFNRLGTILHSANGSLFALQLCNYVILKALFVGSVVAAPEVRLNAGGRIIFFTNRAGELLIAVAYSLHVVEPLWGLDTGPSLGRGCLATIFWQN